MHDRRASQTQRWPAQVGSVTGSPLEPSVSNPRDGSIARKWLFLKRLSLLTYIAMTDAAGDWLVVFGLAPRI
jgi:hypothetical protein